VSTPRTIFLAAAGTVAALVDAIPDTGWDGPGLGVWDLRALVGHTSRSLVTVVLSSEAGRHSRAQSS